MKGVGYLISTLSVFLLGIVAWPKPDEPMWKAAVTIAGMAASIIGMGFRYVSHRREKAELDEAKSRSAPDPAGAMKAA